MGDITKETYDKIKEDENVSHPSHYTWLKDKCNIEVIDIKFSTSTATFADEQIYCFTAMIIYY